MFICMQILEACWEGRGELASDNMEGRNTHCTVTHTQSGQSPCDIHHCLGPEKYQTLEGLLVMLWPDVMTCLTPYVWTGLWSTRREKNMSTIQNCRLH